MRCRALRCCAHGRGPWASQGADHDAGSAERTGAVHTEGALVGLTRRPATDDHVESPSRELRTLGQFDVRSSMRIRTGRIGAVVPLARIDRCRISSSFVVEALMRRQRRCRPGPCPLRVDLSPPARARLFHHGVSPRPRIARSTRRHRSGHQRCHQVRHVPVPATTDPVRLLAARRAAAPPTRAPCGA
jgi:hypothetical protein